MHQIIQDVIKWFKNIFFKLYTANRSFRFQLILSFIFVSILPLIIIQMISYYSITSTLHENINELINVNLQQTQKSLDVMLAGYNDLLYQIYTDDDVVSNMKNIGNDFELAVNVNQIRRRLASYSDAKPLIQSITMIAKNGKVIAYDKLSPSTLESSWFGLYHSEQPGFYQDTLKSKDGLIFSTGEATHFGTNPYYLFHMAHRMVDILNIYQDSGIAVISLDVDLLNEITNEASDTVNRTSVNFLVNADGKLISFPDRTKIGVTLDNRNNDQYIKLVHDSLILNGKNIAVTKLYDASTGWTIVNAVDQSALYSHITLQQQITLLSILVMGVVIIVIILMITKRLSGSIGKVVKAIITAGEGELTVRIEPSRSMPVEIQTIAHRFNRMLSEINVLIADVKDATIKQKEAEIHALEAQINPHFIYNTLDTINWMAIDRDQFEISNMINSLAKILRYAVDKSNAVVTVRDEIDWLRQYVFFQQLRLKNAFECKIEFDNSALDCRIHKLLIQPFVENAILHGFSETHEVHKLAIFIRDCGAWLEIMISDNGIGIPDAVLEQINCNELPGFEQKSHIGIENVQERLEMYYGNRASVTAESGAEGTRITIKIPNVPYGDTQ